MSMDLVLWAACAISIPADLPQADKWSNYGGTDWVYESQEWQVIVDNPSSLTTPKEVLSINKDHKFPLEVVLEPTRANRDGYAFWAKVSESVAIKCGGATLESPMGLIRLDAQGKEIK